MPWVGKAPQSGHAERMSDDGDYGEPPETCGATGAARVRRAAWKLGVPEDYGRGRHLVRVREPTQLVPIGRDIYQRAQWMSPRAAAAWRRMRDAAALAGIELQVVSAYRSAAYQLGIVERKMDRGEDISSILEVNAAPGYSEHHSGRALDITTPGYAALEQEFERSPAFEWLTWSAAKFGQPACDCIRAVALVLASQRVGVKSQIRGRSVCDSRFKHEAHRAHEEVRDEELGDFDALSHWVIDCAVKVGHQPSPVRNHHAVVSVLPVRSMPPAARRG